MVVSRISPKGRVLDLGAGSGHLADRVAAWFRAGRRLPEDHILACDIAEEGFDARGVPFLRIDLNDPLPFPDAAFDLVYSVEVFEHLHRPYDVLRECFRVLKPGGSLIVSTPNILNMGSRWRFLWTGFFDLYQPPSIEPGNGGRLCGHVMPLHAAYYSYGLRRAGFREMRLSCDKIRKGAATAYIAGFPLFALARVAFGRSVRKYDAGVFRENRGILDLLNGWELMTARSLIFAATKPASPGTTP